MYDLSDKELTAVQQLNADYRQAHLVQKIKSTGEICILADENGPFLMQDSENDDEGHSATLLPVWCHPRLAEAFVQGQNLSGLEVKTVPLSVFNDSWRPFLTQEQILIALLPLPNSDFNVMEGAEFCASCLT